MQAALSRHRQRTQDLCAALTEKARVLGPHAKMPTVLELCQEFKTSSTTLNQALNELEQREVLYRVRAVGIFVSPTFQPDVALIIDSQMFREALFSPFCDLLVQRAQERALSHGENFSLHVALPPGLQKRSTPFHVGLVHAIENRQVDGIIAVTLDNDAIEWLAKQNVPLVAFASPAPFLVEHDTEAMIHMGVEALRERGCRRIAMWHPISPLHKRNSESIESANHYFHQDREAFCRALQTAGLKFEPELMHDYRSSVRDEKAPAMHSQREQGYETALAVFAQESPPDGILITNDLMTAGAVKALEKVGIEVGRTVQIATHSNAHSPVLADFEERLIRLEFDAQEVTSELFAMLETLMRREPVASPFVKVAPRMRIFNE